MATIDNGTKNILEEFENTLACENLKENKNLVKMMDDNLSLTMLDYLSNLEIAKHNFSKEALMAAIGHSEKYIYDPKAELIKLKYRPKRKSIVFRDIPKEHQNKEKILEIFDLSGEHNYKEKIVKIEDLNGLFFVYFEDEETTLEIYKWIEKMKENGKDLPLNFSAFVKVENLKKEWLNMGHDDTEDVFGIISNPKEHKLRTLSSCEIEKDLMEIGLKIKHSFSKFDRYDPFLNVQKNYLNHHLSNAKNKFDINSNYKEENLHKGKRSKAYSINYNINAIHKFVPLNKDYPLTDPNKEITKIFINMNFLKKFDMPENLKGNFVDALFNKNAKTQLEHFKKDIQARVRSYTTHNPLPNKNKLNHFENKNYNSAHKTNKIGASDHHDEYNNLRHGQQIQ